MIAKVNCMCVRWCNACVLSCLQCIFIWFSTASLKDFPALTVITWNRHAHALATGQYTAKKSEQKRGSTETDESGCSLSSSFLQKNHGALSSGLVLALVNCAVEPDIGRPDSSVSVLPLFCSLFLAVYWPVANACACRFLARCMVFVSCICIETTMLDCVMCTECFYIVDDKYVEVEKRLQSSTALQSFFDLIYYVQNSLVRVCIGTNFSLWASDWHSTHHFQLIDSSSWQIALSAACSLATMFYLEPTKKEKKTICNNHHQLTWRRNCSKYNIYWQ